MLIMMLCHGTTAYSIFTYIKLSMADTTDSIRPALYLCPCPECYTTDNSVLKVKTSVIILDFSSEKPHLYVVISRNPRIWDLHILGDVLI